MTTDWASSAFRDALVAMVRRRVPERDAEDVAQTVLAEVIASPTRPEQPDAARRWIWGIARNKIADYHRKSRREALESPEVSTPPPDVAVRDLLHWAVGELPAGADAEETFRWLLRESEGEKLEEIARDAQLPPAQVRQRVSRLRRFFRARWAVHATTVGAGAVALALVLYLVLRRQKPGQPGDEGLPPSPMVTPAPPEVAERVLRAREIRAEAMRACDGAAWQRCLDGLDQAARLDPAGDVQAAAVEARRRATDGLARARDAGVVGELPAPDLGMGTMGTTGGSSGGDSLGTGMSSVRSGAPRVRPRRRVGSSMGSGGSSGP